MRKDKFKILLMDNSGGNNANNISKKLQESGISSDQFEIENPSRNGTDQDTISRNTVQLSKLNDKHRAFAQQAIQTIDMQLETPIPDDTKQRLLERKVQIQKCLDENNILSEEMVEARRFGASGGGRSDSIEAILLQDIQSARELNSQLVKALYQPDTAFGYMRSVQKENHLVNVVVIVNHYYASSTSLSPEQDFHELIKEIPEKVPILYVGQAPKALEAGLRDSSIINDRPPRQPFGMTRSPSTDKWKRILPRQPIERRVGESEADYTSRVINGPPATLEPQELNEVTEALVDLIKNRPPHSPPMAPKRL